MFVGLSLAFPFCLPSDGFSHRFFYWIFVSLLSANGWRYVWRCSDNSPWTFIWNVFKGHAYHIWKGATLSANLSLGLLTFQPLFFHFWLGLYANKLCILKKRTWSIRMLPLMLTTLLLLAAALFPPVGGPNFDFYFFVQMVCIFIIEKKEPPNVLENHQLWSKPDADC